MIYTILYTHPVANKTPKIKTIMLLVEDLTFENVESIWVTMVFKLYIHHIGFNKLLESLYMHAFDKKEKKKNTKKHYE